MLIGDQAEEDSERKRRSDTEESKDGVGRGHDTIYRKDLLWQRMLIGDQTEEDSERKRRSDTEESKDGVGRGHDTIYRKDLLWQRMLIGDQTEEDSERKRRSDTEESKDGVGRRHTCFLCRLRSDTYGSLFLPPQTEFSHIFGRFHNAVFP